MGLIEHCLRLSLLCLRGSQLALCYSDSGLSRLNGLLRCVTLRLVRSYLCLRPSHMWLWRCRGPAGKLTRH